MCFRVTICFIVKAPHYVFMIGQGMPYPPPTYSPEIYDISHYQLCVESSGVFCRVQYEIVDYEILLIYLLMNLLILKNTVSVRTIISLKNKIKSLYYDMKFMTLHSFEGKL